MNTILIPTFNESKNPLFSSLLESLKALTHSECLFIDGCSTDDTKTVIRSHGFRVLDAPASNRAHRFNLGIKSARGTMLLLHHPRSVIEKEGLSYFDTLRVTNDLFWGGFHHQFDIPHPILKFTSWYSNRVRPKRGILYLDHCLVIPRQWLEEIGGVPEVDIFEDTLLSLKLKPYSKPRLLRYRATTSAIRFQKNGYIKQAWRNQIMKWQFYLGKNHQSINRAYEKDINLNILR